MRTDSRPSPWRRRPIRRRVAPLVLYLLAISGFGPTCLAEGPSPLIWSGFGLARGASVDAATSWRDGGFGVFDTGRGPGDDETAGVGQLHLILESRPSDPASPRRVGAYLHALARAEPDGLEGRAAGVVEAYVELEIDARAADLWHLRLGHFLLPTSRENVDLGWSSPYTLSFSALNTWIGEEVRSTGLLAAYHLAVGAADELRVGGGPLIGNDTSGTLLAWRGFTLGDRLGVYGEVAPLPPLRGFAPGGAFEPQDDRGTRAFGSDLDDRAGWTAFVRYARPEAFTLQYTRYDNRGDRQLYGDEYAWRTELDLVGGDLHLGPLTLAGEWMTGSTGMGDITATHAQLDFRAHYLLASYAAGAYSFSLRYDDFETVERDRSVAYDPNDGAGSAWTVAAFYESPRRPLRVGVEWLDADARRTAAGLVTGEREVGGRSLALELRYHFGG